MAKKSAKKPTKNQLKLFAFLRQKNESDTKFTADDLAQATGLMPSSIRTYLNEGHYSTILETVEPGIFKVVPDISTWTEKRLQKEVSQSRHVRSSLLILHEPISQELACRSRDNMILALESYNRPSLGNRIDAFLVLFCMAWEQLLKSLISERDGEQAIYTGNFRDGRRETKPLAHCIEQVFSKGDMVRENLVFLKNLRDQAVHLLVPEIQQPLSRAFQSGVINYSEFFHQVTGHPFIEHSSPGLMAIVCVQPETSNTVIIGKYGPSMAKDVLDVAAKIKQAEEKYSDSRFAVPIDIKIGFANKSDGPNLQLAHSGNNSVDAVVVEKTVSEFKTYKYLQKQIVEEINSRLLMALGKDEMKKRGVVASNGTTKFTKGHFEKICRKEKWKNGNNIYHKKFDDYSLVKYTDSTVGFIVDGVLNNPDFLARYKTW